MQVCALAQSCRSFLQRIQHEGIVNLERQALAGNESNAVEIITAGLLDPELCLHFINEFRQYVLPCVNRLVERLPDDTPSYERAMLFLARIASEDQVFRASVNVLVEYASPLTRLGQDGSDPAIALEAAVLLLRSFPGCRDAWAWDPVFKLLSDDRVRGLAASCIGTLLRLTSDELEAYLQYMKVPVAGVSVAQSWKDSASGPQTEHFQQWDSTVGFRVSHGEQDPGLVLTPTTVQSIKEMLVALTVGRPCVVSGSAGCGKTFLISFVAKLVGQERPLFLHVDETTDSKALVGAYVCGSKPGEFEWQAGVLSTALTSGQWLVMEDLCTVPVEILALLEPLSSRRLPLPERHTTIDAHPNFRLLGTLSTTEDKADAPTLCANWIRVALSTPTDQEVGTIVTTRFPELEPIAVQLLEAFHRAQRIASTCSGCPRQLCLRDLMKLCERAKDLVLLPHFTEEMRVRLMRHANTVLFAAIPDTLDRIHCLAAFGAEWDLQQEISTHIVLSEKPPVEITETHVKVGESVPIARNGPCEEMQCYAYTAAHSRVLQSLVSTVTSQEPALLVGDTGVGKTTVVQQLASILGHPVVVYNFNDQSEASELLGNFQPVDVGQTVVPPLMERFMKLFRRTFSKSANEKLITKITADQKAKKFQALMSVLKATSGKALTKLDGQSASDPRKTQDLVRDWTKFRSDVLEATCALKGGMLFEFREGMLIDAMRTGSWIILDEINLAPSDVLQRIVGLLEPGVPFPLPEAGGAPITPHPEFRIFACMNPPSVPMPHDENEDQNEKKPKPAGFSAGKKQLPAGIRSRFTEIFVDEPNARADIELIAKAYLARLPNPPVAEIVDFFLEARKIASALSDGSGKAPHFSLRTLTRALRFALRVATREHHKLVAMEALVAGLLMAFATPLDSKSAVTMTALIYKSLNTAPPKQKASTQVSTSLDVKIDGEALCVDGFWVQSGPLEVDVEKAHRDYVVTPSVRSHLRNVARILSGGRFPVLLEGPTSSGKTSLVKFIANLTGHQFLRINNHEHTDLQEYIGQYVCDESGQLVFQEGPLVHAARNGTWVVLDELNLAPSEVLEALNRLLDDNRELFIPDTNTVVKAHPDFMIFATQNPAGGAYGGRKLLSRAFRNRFIDIFVDDLPMSELATVISKRCVVPPSICQQMMKVYQDLQTRRNQESVFSGKRSFMTVRDLLRWGNRHPSTGEELAREGYMLLAERLRKPADQEEVRKVLEKHCKGVKTLDMDYTKDPMVIELQKRVAHLPIPITWTSAACRLAALTARCVKYDEPALLVGETGCGKTTICQVLALAMEEAGSATAKDDNLSIVNCHLHTETADFLGSLRPRRTGARAISQLLPKLDAILALLDEQAGLEDMHRVVLALQTALQTEVDIEEATQATTRTWEKLLQQSSKDETLKAAVAPVTNEMRALNGLILASTQLFEWVDGPLVQRMEEGGCFLLDEVSLAEDSVLERLNSVLEPERVLFLAEKPATGKIDMVKAVNTFRIFATMNPGGDFGKKELSPALRNRFTEIWVPAMDFTSPDSKKLVIDRLGCEGSGLLAGPLLRAVCWFNANAKIPLSVRDVLWWSAFINTTSAGTAEGLMTAYLHGGCGLLVDQLGLGNDLVSASAKASCQLSATQMTMLGFLLAQTNDEEFRSMLDDEARNRIRENFGEEGLSWVHQANASRKRVMDVSPSAGKKHVGEMAVTDVDVPVPAEWGLGPFKITCGPTASEVQDFDFTAPGTACNVGRVIRGMQMPKAILLEGPPGIGKTATVEALAKKTGHRLVRINLSEQTEIIDLLGSDLPSATGGNGPKFEWCDGVLLRALKMGEWVLLDELNLASQSVLEGLNALLDHRSEVYLPEIDKVVKASPGFRLFAAQNPLADGGGRKGLPKSFLNRFTKVALKPLSRSDLQHILTHRFPTITPDVLERASDLVDSLAKLAAGQTIAELEWTPVPIFAGYHEWDWNLRDVLRFCGLLQSMSPREASDLLFIRRLRRPQDRSNAANLVRHYFPTEESKIDDHTESFAFTRDLLTEERQHRFGTLAALEGASEDLQIEAPADTAEARAWDLAIGNGKVTVGSASVNRIGGQNSQSPSTFLASQSSAVRALMHAVELNWPVMMTGGPAAGKASTIRWLAAVVGAELLEVPLTPSMDAAELLGCFEQADPSRHRSAWIREAQDLLTRLSRELYHADGAKCAQLFKLLNNLRKDTENIKKLNEFIAQGAESFAGKQEFADLASRAEKLWTATDASGCFEWIDGALLNAIQRGLWVMLPHAHLCAPAVLDRLNSLLEPNGRLLMTETGEERIVVPHPSFRIFFTVDSTVDSGRQVSKALRNRCLEVFLESDSFAGLSSNVLPSSFKFMSKLDILLNDASEGTPEVLADIIRQRLQEEEWCIPSLGHVIDTTRVIQAHASLPAAVQLQMAVTHATFCHLIRFLRTRSTANRSDLTEQALEGRANLSAALTGYSVGWRCLEKWAALATTSALICSGTVTDILRDTFRSAYVSEGKPEIHQVLVLVFDAIALLSKDPDFEISAGFLKVRAPLRASNLDGSAVVMQQLLPLMTKPNGALLRIFLERSMAQEKAKRLDMLQQVIIDLPEKDIRMQQARQFLDHPLIATISKIAETSFCGVHNAIGSVDYSVQGKYLRSLGRAAVAYATHMVPDNLVTAEPESLWSLSRAFHEGQLSIQALPHPGLAVLCPWLELAFNVVIAAFSMVPEEGTPEWSECLHIGRELLRYADRLKEVLVSVKKDQWQLEESRVLAAVSVVLTLLRKLEDKCAKLKVQLPSTTVLCEQLVYSISPAALNDPPPTDAFTQWGGLRAAYRTYTEWSLEQRIMASVGDEKCIDLLAILRSCGALRSAGRSEDADALEATLETRLAEDRKSSRLKPVDDGWDAPEALFQWRSMLTLIRYIWSVACNLEESQLNMEKIEGIVARIATDKQINPLFQALASLQQYVWQREAGDVKIALPHVALEMLHNALGMLRKVTGRRAFMLGSYLPPKNTAEAGYDLSSLVLLHGGQVTFAWNYCAWVVPKTSMINVGTVKSQLGELMSPDVDVTAAGDWHSLQMFLLAVFHGVVADIDILHKSLADIVTAVRDAMQGKAFNADGAMEALAWLDAQLGQASTPEVSFPITRSAVIVHYARPILAIFQVILRDSLYCTDVLEIPLRGLIWTLASMWRLQSGGSQIWPGGRDPKEETIRQTRELEHSMNCIDTEIEHRQFDELLVSGRCEGLEQEGASVVVKDLTLERAGVAAVHSEVSKKCCLRPDSVPVDMMDELRQSCPDSFSGDSIKRYTDLCKEVEHFAQNVASYELVNDLMPLLSILAKPGLKWSDVQHQLFQMTGETSSARVALFCSSADRFSTRLADSFPLHVDLVQPVVFSVHALIHGVQMVFAAARLPEPLRSSASAGAELVQTVTRIPQFPPQDFSTDMSLPESKNLSPHRLVRWLLRWHAVIKKSGGSVSLDGLFALMQEVGRVHDEQFSKMRDAEKERLSAYRQNLTGEDNEEDKPTDEDADVETFFPQSLTIEAEMRELDTLIEGKQLDMDMSTGGAGLYDTWAPTSAPEKKEEATSNNISDEVFAEICDLALLAFGANQLDDQEVAALRGDALQDSYDLAMAALRGKADEMDNDHCVVIPGGTEEQMVPLMSHHLNRVLDQLAETGLDEEPKEEPKEGEEEEDKDKDLRHVTMESIKDLRKRQKFLNTEAVGCFYASSSPGLVTAIRPVLEPLMKRTQELLDQYPEHPALVSFLALCEKIRDLPLLHTTPINVVQALELLLVRGELWEKVASRAVSLRDLLKAVQRMVINLRARQLKDWRSMRTNREGHWRRKGAFWWFHLINMNLSYDGDAKAFTDELLRFLRISPIGEFDLRIRMIRAVSKMMETGGKGEISKILLHVANYADVWQPAVVGKLELARKDMDKEVTDLSKLARWDLQNHVALKESVHRGHYQLSRAIKRFDEKLQNMTDTVLVELLADLNQLKKVTDPLTGLRPSGELHKVEDYVLAAKVWSKYSEDMKSVAPVARFEDTDEFWTSDRVAGAAPQLLGAFRKVCDRMLQTVPAFTDAPLVNVAAEYVELFNGAEKQIQDMDTKMPVKRRTIVTVKDELAAAGIPCLPMADTIFSPSALFTSEAVPDEEEWEVVKQNLYRSQHWFMRMLSVKPNAELSAADFKRWSGYGFGVMRLLEQHRNRTTQFHKTVTRFSAMRAVIADSRVVPSENVSIIVRLVARLSEAVRQWQVLPSAESSSGYVSSQRAIVMLDGIQERIRDSPELAAWPLEEHPVLRARLSWLEDIQRTATEVLALLELADAPHQAVVRNLTKLATELKNAADTLQTAGQATDKSIGEDERAALRIMLMAMQKAGTQLKNDPAMSCWRPEDKTKTLDELLEGEKNDERSRFGLERNELPSLSLIMPFEGPLLDRFEACLLNGGGQVLDPFAQQLALTGEAILAASMDALVGCSEVTLRLLAFICFHLESGYCRSQEDDGEGEEGDTQFDCGTGMGSGDGMKDVTDQLEDESQLEGLQNEQNDDAKPPPDGEDKAMDVGFDIDGEMQNQPQDQDQGEGDEDKDPEDMDKQMGNVDMSEGGELDEKLWNGEDEDDKNDEPTEEDKNEKQKEDIEAQGGEQQTEADMMGNDDEKEDDQGDDKKDGGKQKEFDQNEQQEEDDFEEQQEGEHYDAKLPEMGAPDDQQQAEDNEMDLDENMELDGDMDMGEEQNAEGEDENGEEDENAKGDDAEGEGDEMDGENEQENGEQEDTSGDIVQDAEEQDDSKEEEKPALGEDAAPSKPPEGEKDDKGTQGADEQKPEEKPEDKGEEAQEEKKDAKEEEEKAQQVQAGVEGEQSNAAMETMEAGGNDQNQQEEDDGQKQQQEQPDADGPEQACNKPNGSQAAQKPRDQAPNPFNDTKAAERWLNKIEVDAPEAEEQGEKESAEQGEDEAEKAEPNGQYEADADAGMEGVGAAKEAQEMDGVHVMQDENEEPKIEEEAADKADTKEEAENAMDVDDDNKKNAGKNEADKEEAEIGEVAKETINMEDDVAKVTNESQIITNIDALEAMDEEDPTLEDAEENFFTTEDDERTEAELMEQYRQIESETAGYASALCEQLRIVLEPTLKGRMQGDYKTGKRISMRKVIAYIASQYRRDKIWLRRSKPSKRQYQVMICIDNSRSMSECGVAPLALQSLFTLCQALVHVEVGEFGVVSYGADEAKEILPLGGMHGASFGFDQAKSLLNKFTFKEEAPDSHQRSFSDMLKLCSKIFEGRPGSNLSQMMLIVSDGRLNKDAVRPWVQHALANRQMPLLIVVDAGRSDTKTKTIFDVKQVKYDNGKPEVLPYLDDFPFPYYVVIQDLNALPHLLADVVRQWFELAANS